MSNLNGLISWGDNISRILHILDFYWKHNASEILQKLSIREISFLQNIFTVVINGNLVPVKNHEKYLENGWRPKSRQQ